MEVLARVNSTMWYSQVNRLKAKRTGLDVWLDIGLNLLVEADKHFRHALKNLYTVTGRLSLYDSR